jgi:hypothetical protein
MVPEELAVYAIISIDSPKNAIGCKNMLLRFIFNLE